jgi:S1-C subfamily serine protease
MKSFLRSQLVSAAVGGIAVAGVFLALGITGRRTVRTVIEEAPLSAEPASDDATGLTPYEIYEDDSRGVVFVRAVVSPSGPNPFALSDDDQSGVSTGSGFVVNREGDILTNYHLIAGAQAGGISVEFAPGVTAVAEVVGSEPKEDLTVLRVDPLGLHLRPLELGNSTTARVGDPTLAIGNPFGLDRTLSEGIVSALQRQISGSDGFAIDHVIQTDTSVDPGISGGPLIDAAGRVIGINSQIQTDDDGDGDGTAVSFAVPINTATALLARLGAPGTSAFLGVDGVTVDAALSALGVPARHGVLVQAVDPTGPAARAGLRPGRIMRVVHGRSVYLGGDVIEGIDGAAANSVGDLKRDLASERPGEVVSLTVLRGVRVETVKVRLTSSPTTRGPQRR